MEKTSFQKSLPPLSTLRKTTLFHTVLTFFFIMVFDASILEEEIIIFDKI
jgi:hypothetical protein